MQDTFSLVRKGSKNKASKVIKFRMRQERKEERRWKRASESRKVPGGARGSHSDKKTLGRKDGHSTERAEPLSGGQMHLPTTSHTNYSQ